MGLERRTGQLPIEVYSGLDESHLKRFDRQFIQSNRDELELLWRRTQQPETRDLSGMESDEDRRRRMIHGLDKYQVVESNEGVALVISDPYLWFQVVSPSNETAKYMQRMQEALILGRWGQEQGGNRSDMGMFRLGDLTLEYRIKDQDEEDVIQGRVFPSNYNILEITLHGGKEKPESKKRNPWAILKSGMRVKDIRGCPDQLSDLKQLEKFSPFQVELGCGPSIEAGIPPLHYFHTLYKVSEPIKGNFIFGPQRDTFLSDLVANPNDFYRRAAALYAAALTTEPTPFYYLLNRLNSSGIVVGDIITNNFDGLCSLVELHERYVRRFDEPKNNLYPKVEFHPDAKSLLVVGAHADRRRVERSAREQGLQVIYIDPEGYVDENTGKFVSYPLESAQDSDILIKMTANQFTDSWVKTFE